MVSNGQIRLDFVCVHNAGRSQIAAAFAERERSERDLEDVIEIHSGGTEPGDTVHEEVLKAMGEVGIDISGRSPKWIADLDDLKDTDYLITMGCFISEFDPAQYGVESYEWDLANPDGQDMETVREIRDEIERKIKTLFDEIERVTEKERANADSSGSVVTTIRDFLSP